MALILLHQRPPADSSAAHNGTVNTISTTFEEEENDLTKSLSSSHLDDTADSPRPLALTPKASISARIDISVDESTVKATPLIKSKATLIITPPSILYQWQSELASHAPSLDVYIYEGYEGVTAEELAGYDVVLATYNALGQDIHVARYQERLYRHKKQYVPRKSLFTQIHWWRVCLDEAQMVEISTSKAAEMANMLVRTHSWAISGTPVKKQSEDLYGLLLFLGVEPYASHKKLWRLVLHPSFRPLFLRCFQRIMRRHAKKDVEQELKIPPQRRLAHRIEFTEIERTNYLELWEEFLREVSWQTVEDGSADIELLRTWLLRLRQTCCHPQIGAKNAQVLGGRGELRTITQVLDSMLSQAMSNLNVQERTLVTMKLNRAILQARINKSIDVVSAFEIVLGEIRRQIEKWSKMIIEDRSRIRLAKQAARLAEQSADGNGDDQTHRNDRNGRDSRNKDEEDDDNDESNLLGDDEAEGGNSSLVRPGRSATTLEGQLSMKRAILRRWMEQEHRALFFEAGLYHDLEMEEKETQHYEAAEKVRLKLLSNAERMFLRRKAKLEIEVRKMANLNNQYVIPASKVGHGIVLQSVIERLEDLVNILNQQLQMMQSWREDLVKRLLQPLMQDGEEGEQYQYSIELQHTLEAYLHYYGRMLLLRKDLLGGTADTFVTHKNSLKARREQAEMIARREQRAAASNGLLGLPQKENTKDGSGQNTAATETQAEKQVDKVEQLDKQLETDLDSIIRPELEQSLRAFRNEIRSLPVRRDMPEIEKTMCELEAQRLSEEVERQMELCQVLELEMAQFRILTADRTRYYRALQQISDTVRDIESIDPEADIKKSLQEEQEVSMVITQMATKLRYLNHLAETTSKRTAGSESSNNVNAAASSLKQQGADGEGQGTSGDRDIEEEHWCLVCRGGSEFGTLTACGHVFCEECLNAWIAVRSVCPACMAPIVKRQLTRVHMGTPKAANSASKENAGEGSSHHNSTESNVKSTSVLATHLYGEIQQVPEAINAMPIYTGYGSKTDSITRHIAFLIKENPSVKCIVFSQWQSFLDLLSTSFDMNKIGYVKLTGSHGRQAGRGKAVQQFKDDPNKYVFMLHAKSQSAGLTLLAATHVFICEPLVNPVLQAQAVNRVHRIGQTKETFVHYYLIQDTIEMPVYDLFEQKMAACAGASNHQHTHDVHDVNHPSRKRLSSSQHSGQSYSPSSMEVDEDENNRNEQSLISEGKNKGKGRAQVVLIESDRMDHDQQDDSFASTTNASNSDDDDDQQVARPSSTEPSLTANAAKEAQDRSGELVRGEDVLYCFRAAKEAADLALRIHDMGMRV
ncbi:hypothetical protein BGW41_002650 [Actinomortierella wolfii]|nr:hypothetical protein BGW41_002650 [Actinomortierella wolfii]